MAMKQTNSTLLSKLGDKARKAHEAHRYDDTEYSSFGDLPPGIKNGVAQLVDCKFVQIAEGKQGAGNYMFYAAGSVQIPKVHDGVPIEGLRTQISCPVFDTPDRKNRQTVADHLKWIYNELRKLGVNTAEMELDELEATVAALVEAGPYFRFKTFQSEPTPEFPDPKVQHIWLGLAENYEPEEPEKTDDGSEEEDEETVPPAKTLFPSFSNGAATKIPAKAAVKSGNARVGIPPTKTKPAVAAPVVSPAAVTSQAKGKTYAPPKAAVPIPASKGKRVAPPAEEPEEEDVTTGDGDFDEFGDLDSLQARAEADDDDAQQTLTNMAINAGASDEDVTNAKSWAEIVDMITNTQGTEGEREEEEEQPTVPEVGQVWNYRPTDPRTRKPVTKSQECEVIKVDEAKGTVTLKNLNDQKVKYQSVPFDRLEE